MDALASVPSECRYDTRFLLENLADLKYSGKDAQDPQRVRNYIEQAKALVSRIAEAQRKAAEEDATKESEQ